MRVLKHTPIALAALLALGAGSAFTQPAATQLPVQRPGGAIINATVGAPANNALTVTQTASGSNRGLVEWSSFSIGSQARVNIVQPNAQSVLVNRIVGSGSSGPSASEIYGSLSANGRVFLVNPSGVVFGGSAQVNVGSLVATNLDLDPAMTANNYQRLMSGADVQLSGGGGSGVQVLGAIDPQRPQIQVTEGGSIVLLSRDQVVQNGSIAAPGGHIALGTGSTATLRPVGNSGFVELLTLQAGAGSVEFGAHSLTVANGSTGGRVNIQGDDIRLRNGSQVSADGITGGGYIDVGNDATRSIVVEQGATLSADATGAGNGGSIALRAMYNNHSANPVARVDYGVTEVYGSLRARGGVNGGNGGSIETSGATVNTRLASADGTLTQRGVVDASARTAGGIAGTWTLDPYNVTISDATASGVDGNFVPTGPGANINAADLSAALDAGTSVAITTGTAQVGTEAGDITLARGTTVSRTAGTGTATLTLSAHNNIVLEATSTIQASSTSPLNVNLYSNSDDTGSGSVIVSGTVRTGGGNVDIGGGAKPATGYALSNNQIDGVALNAAVIDTTGATGRGDVSMRGEAPSGSSNGGVSLASSSITANNITIVGLGSQGAAVALSGSVDLPSTLDTAGGLISVRGFADGVVSTGGGTTGVIVEQLNVNLGSAGSLYVAGRAVNRSSSTFGPAGVRYRDTNIVAAPDNKGTITLAGELVGNQGLGGLAYLNAQSGPLTINGGVVNGTTVATGANVVLAGSSDASPAVDLGLSAGTTIQTTGTVNLRPVGVSAAGDLVEQPATTIQIGVEPLNGVFYVNTTWLLTPNVSRPGIGATGGVVIGSSAHTGSITVEDSAFQQHGDVSVTLQNQGAGSAGITLGSGNTLQNLGLRTSGNVAQTGALTVTGNLVVEGGAQSTVTLDNAGNAIGTLAFDPPASFTLQNTGALAIGAAGAGGYTPGTGFTPLNIINSIGGSTALIQSDTAVNINQSVSMSGANAKLDIVAPTITLAPGATVTAPAGGSAKLWATSFTGTAPGTNLYGCVFGDQATCSVSGIALPTTGNQVLHPNQPTLAVAANPTTAYQDLPLPALTYTATGLQNGDTAAGALTGTLGTAPAGSSTFAINQGTLTSPTGYNVTFTPSTLTLRPGITRQMLQSSFQAEMASDVYGRNLDQPYICTAASVIRGTLADEKQSDPLASEWGKVRNQPQLSGCLNVTDGGSCSAF